jgi:hypothetical protein
LEACEIADFRRQAANVLAGQVQGSLAFFYRHFDELQQFVLSHKGPALLHCHANPAGKSYQYN